MISVRGVLGRRNIVKVAMACAVSAPVSGHHSEAGIDPDSTCIGRPNAGHNCLQQHLADPEYMAAPMTHSRELIYSPQMEMSRFNCDPEAARRFVPL